MGEQGNLLFWGVLIVAALVFMVLPQVMNRRRRKRREEELQVGDTIITIGGIIGEITYLSWEANICRLKLAEGLEIRLLPSAISGKRSDEGAADAEDAGQAD